MYEIIISFDIFALIWGIVLYPCIKCPGPVELLDTKMQL